MSRPIRSLFIALFVVLLLAGGGILGYFLWLNTQWVIVKVPALPTSLSEPLPTVEYEVYLAGVILAAFGSGFGVGLFLVIPSWFRRGFERHRERRFIHDLEGELADLRQLPIKDPAPFEPADAELSSERSADDEAADEAELLAAALRGAPTTALTTCDKVSADKVRR